MNLLTNPVFLLLGCHPPARQEPKAMKQASSRAARLLKNAAEEDFAAVLDVGLNPIQRLLRGNGFTSLPEGHPQHPSAKECWEKKLAKGKRCWVFPLPESSKEYRGRREPVWRWEVDNGRFVFAIDLPESAMLDLLRSLLQRLATWNKRKARIPGGSSPGTFF